MSMQKPPVKTSKRKHIEECLYDQWLMKTIRETCSEKYITIDWLNHYQKWVIIGFLIPITNGCLNVQYWNTTK